MESCRIKSLRALSSHCVARNLIRQLEQEYLSLPSTKKWILDSFERTRALLHPIKYLPSELLRQILDHVLESAPFVGFIAACLISDVLESICMPFNDTCPPIAIPTDLLRACVAQITPNITTIHVGTIAVDDHFLVALADSQSAAGLISLSVPGAMITDRSASAWEKFASLQELNISSCDLLSFSTLECIAKSTSLRSLTGSQLPRCTNKLTLVQTLIGDESRLPNIERIDLDLRLENAPPTEIFEPFAQLIQAQQPHRAHKITNLFNESSFFISGTMDMQELATVHGALPLLSRPFADWISWSDLAALETFLEHFVELDLRMETTPFSTKIALWLAEKCPRLETLSLDAYTLEPNCSLDPLSTLATLDLSSCGTPSNVAAWPPHLRVLNLQLNAPPASDSQSKFINTIARVTTLQELRINNVLLFSDEDVKLFLSALPALKELNVARSLGKLIQLRHPSLTSVRESIGNFQLSHLPELTSLRLTNPFVATRVSPATTPNLRLISSMGPFYHSVTPRSSKSPLIRDAFVAISSLVESLTMLDLREHFLPELIQPIKKLTRLQSLALCVSVPVALDIASSLPLLAMLAIYEPEKCNREIKFVSHSRLNHLLIQMPTGSSIKLSLRGELNPHLTTIQVYASNSIELELDSFQQLKSVQCGALIGFGPSTNVYISNCPNFTHLTMTYSQITQLRLSSLPNMYLLEFSAVGCFDANDFIYKGLPSAGVPYVVFDRSTTARSSPEFISRLESLKQLVFGGR